MNTDPIGAVREGGPFGACFKKCVSPEECQFYLQFLPKSLKFTGIMQRWTFGRLWLPLSPRPTCYLLAGEARDDRGEIVDVGLMDDVIGDVPALAARLEIFDHLGYRPDKHVGAFEKFVRR